MPLKVLILGVNGFIGSHLTKRILETTNWDVFGIDMSSNKIDDLISNSRFHFIEGDITINKEWIHYHVKKCDVALPLVAIATPATYVSDPIQVFELDFEANLDIIRHCAKYKTRVVFPSTSEVYGMSPDREFDEETTNFVLGPIHKERWIYSCSKQLLDRVIFALGKHQGLSFTLFRPFNWIGPKLDNIFEAKEGSSRVLTQFIGNIIRGEDIKLVDGGMQRRSFTDIDDGIDALMKIIANKNGCAASQIFNLGNPNNDIAIKDLALLLLDMIGQYPDFQASAAKTQLIPTNARDYYGKGYQDIQTRVPSIANAKRHLDWSPTIHLRDAIKKTLDYHLVHESDLISA